MKIAFKLILMFAILALVGVSIGIGGHYIIEKQELVERIEALVILGITTIVLIGIVGFSFSKDLIREITGLRDAADKISKGNLTEPIKTKSKDEIGELAESFDDMRYSLKMVIDEYEKMKGEEELLGRLKKEIEEQKK